MLIVSCHSLAGSLSRTTPAPAWRCTVHGAAPPFVGTTIVRSASAMSMSPVYEIAPMPPEYGPRRVGSSSSITSIARTFGAPDTVPTGSVARSAS